MDEAWIVPEGMLPEELKTNPIGTGPFMFEAWDRGQEIRLTKFDDYWEEGLPYLDGVVIKFIQDIDVRIAQYRQGDLDMILNVPAARVPEMRPISSIPILESDKILNTGIYFVLLNNRIAPFDNELVRRAFSYAVDRDQFIRGVAGGFSAARATLIADDSPHSISDVENDYYPQNIAKARELLAQAGYPDGIEFELMWHRTGPQWETGAQIIQASVKDAGIDITLKGEEVATLLTRLRDSRDYQAGFSATAVKPTLLPLAVGLDRPPALALRRDPRGPSRVVAAAAGRHRAGRGRVPRGDRRPGARARGGAVRAEPGPIGGVRLAEQGPGRLPAAPAGRRPLQLRPDPVRFLTRTFHETSRLAPSQGASLV